MKGLVTVCLWPCAWFPCLDAGGRTPQLDYSLPEESKHSHLPVSFSTSGSVCVRVCVGGRVGVRVGEVKKYFHNSNDAWMCLYSGKDIFHVNCAWIAHMFK